MDIQRIATKFATAVLFIYCALLSTLTQIGMEDLRETATLVIAGFFGSLVRLMLAPPERWQRWVARFIVGVSSAVFLGPPVGHMIAKWSGLDASGTLPAAGFLTGVTAEQLIVYIQSKLSNAEVPKVDPKK